MIGNLKWCTFLLTNHHKDHKRSILVPVLLNAMTNFIPNVASNMLISIIHLKFKASTES